MLIRIHHVAELLEEPPSVLRHWQKKLGIHVLRTKAGQRWYQPEDVAAFRLAKQLIRREGYTLAGARERIQTLERWK
jgi:DNA-binding transcriptional MerR regulator